MIVKLKDHVLAQLLVPGLELFSTGPPTEYIGDLYGYRLGPHKNRLAVITDAFPYLTPERTSTSVDYLDDPVHRKINRNLDDILAPEKTLLGDFHIHPIHPSTDKAVYRTRTPDGFMRAFGHFAGPSRGDSRSMKKNGQVYLILAFGERKFDHENTYLSDKKSLFGTTQDFVYAISGWTYNRKRTRFQKLKITL